MKWFDFNLALMAIAIILILGVMESLSGWTFTGTSILGGF